jgi:hypothetical protein
MEVNIASIVILNGKAYMPVYGRTENGLFMEIDPVFTCGLFKEEMTEVLQKVRDVGHPLIQTLALEESRKHKDPMLKATNTKSWKELARQSVSYTISWSQHGLLMEMSKLDKQGRWEYDPGKTKELPLDTPLGSIVQIVLDDFYSRSFR